MYPGGARGGELGDIEDVSRETRGGELGDREERNL